MMNFRRFAGILITASVVTTSGCFRIGPNAVSDGRTRYNTVIQNTDGEQLLLNLVRLKYRESPYFLGVASVSQSFENTIGGGGSGTFPEDALNTFGLNLSFSYLEAPTITYTPLQGDAFARQLLTPIEYEKLALVLNSGWSISRVFRLTVQEMNGLKNAPSASGPTPLNEPEFRSFREAVDNLRLLEIRGQAGLVYVEDGDEIALALAIDPAATDSPEAVRFRELMDLDPMLTEYVIGSSAGKNRIAVIPRPLIASLFFVSQAVQVPEKHRERGYVTQTSGANGDFDWNEVTEGLMRIEATKSGAKARKNAFHVKYRDYWYYIPDSDLSSKSTFFLLQQLFALQAGDVKGSVPVLTLPVSR